MRTIPVSTLKCLLPCMGLLAAGVSEAHSIRQKVGAYADNEGLTRQRVGLEAGLDSGTFGPGMSASRVDITTTRDMYQRDDLGEDEFAKEHYGLERVNDSIGVTASQTWERLTDTRVLANYTTDRVIRSRTFGAGASQWLNHETLRISADLSRTILERPAFEVLDYDFVPVEEPALSTSTGVQAGVRHLATPTTIVDYTAGHVVSANRPASWTGGVAVRQFVVPLEGAVHASATRALNHGRIGVDTTYGQVDAWIFETAYLQELWEGARSRLGYRYYREDEITRVHEDKKTFGSDTVSLGMSQDLPKGTVDGIGPLTLEAAAARYLTNTGILARTFEMGVRATF